MAFVERWSEIKPATEEVQKMTEQLKQEAEDKMKKKYKKFTAETYQYAPVYQLIIGTNYCIKVEADCDDHLYLYLFRELGVSRKLVLEKVVQRELSKLHPATELAFSLDQIKQQAEHRTDKNYHIFRGINYKTLLPEREGTATCFIKVQVGEVKKGYLILRVDHGPNSKPTLKNLLEKKNLNSPIEYFE
uniref:Cystatin domain-containing protein n=1 Tax=Esox lucius TaxID=8010 RepID=A0AAY5K0M5_ESOLU